MTTRLLLARHGAFDRSGTIGGPDDGLNALGRREAEALACYLADRDVASIYSSTLKRALQTAEIVSGQLGLGVRPEPRLREWDPGEWMGVPEEEIKAKYPVEWHRLQTDPGFTPPGGEHLSDLVERVYEAVGEIAGAHPNESVLLVSHGGALSALICRVLHVDFDALSRAYFRGEPPFTVVRCAVSTVEFREAGPVLLSLNDACHLDGLTP